jgi:dihydropteroate synthase
MIWQTTRFQIDLKQPKVMGIVNVTPDSFSDGGQYATTGAAIKRCEQLIKDGADLLDIGGESSRPGAVPLALDEELARVLPVLDAAVKLGVPISVDTYKPQVMQAALDRGVDIINDIWALRYGGNGASVAKEGAAPNLTALQVVSAHANCGLCLMHMYREPQTMQLVPMEGDVIPQVLSFWKRTIEQIRGQSIHLNRIVVDPGIGFGKTSAQNFSLLARQRELLAINCPLLVGWSRKSSLAGATSASLATLATLDPKDRMVPSVAAALLAVQRGASVVRVHDVRETVQALKVLSAIN